MMKYKSDDANNLPKISLIRSFVYSEKKNNDYWAFSMDRLTSSANRSKKFLSWTTWFNDFMIDLCTCDDVRRDVCAK